MPAFSTACPGCVQALVLAHTPGMPLEWIYARLGFGWGRREKLRAMIHAVQSDEWSEMDKANAASVVQGDGWRMMTAVCLGYSGPAPLWSKIELANDVRSDAAIGQVLGVYRKKVWRWRKNAVFCPLTGARLVPNRGRPLLQKTGSLPIMDVLLPKS